MAVFFKKISASLSKIISTNRCDICHVGTAGKKGMFYELEWASNKNELTDISSSDSRYICVWVFAGGTEIAHRCT